VKRRAAGADDQAARGALRVVLGGLARNGHLEAVLELVDPKDLDDVLEQNAIAQREYQERTGRR
jgi:hypothetical protein